MNWLMPGSPWRPERPRSWLSTRRASCRSVPRTKQPAHLDNAFAQLDVGAAPGHVGGDGDRARLAGLRDDARLFGVVLGVEDLVRDAAPLQHLREALGLLHGDGADQYRLLPLYASAISSAAALNLAFSVL